MRRKKRSASSQVTFWCENCDRPIQVWHTRSAELVEQLLELGCKVADVREGIYPTVIGCPGCIRWTTDVSDPPGEKGGGG